MLLAALSVQFILDGLRDFGPRRLTPARPRRARASGQALCATPIFRGMTGNRDYGTARSISSCLLLRGGRLRSCAERPECRTDGETGRRPGRSSSPPSAASWARQRSRARIAVRRQAVIAEGRGSRFPAAADGHLPPSTLDHQRNPRDFSSWTDRRDRNKCPQPSKDARARPESTADRLILLGAGRPDLRDNGAEVGPDALRPASRKSRLGPITDLQNDTRRRQRGDEALRLPSSAWGIPPGAFDRISIEIRTQPPPRREVLTSSLRAAGFRPTICSCSGPAKDSALPATPAPRFWSLRDSASLSAGYLSLLLR